MDEFLAKKIDKIVKQYKDLFPDEDFKVRLAVELLREQLRDKKFATTKGTDTMDRHLLEWPETLYNMMTMKLSGSELKELQSTSGSRWFAKHYPEYKVPDEI